MVARQRAGKWQGFEESITAEKRRTPPPIGDPCLWLGIGVRPRTFRERCEAQRIARASSVMGLGATPHTRAARRNVRTYRLDRAYGVQAAASGTAVGPLAYVKVALPVHIPAHVDGLVIRE